MKNDLTQGSVMKKLLLFVLPIFGANLLQAAISVVGKNEEFGEIHHYYTTREKNPLKKMQSLIAVACKLIRVFYAVLTKGTSYDASKMLEDIKRPESKLQAA